MSSPAMPLEDFIALCEQAAKDGKCLSDVGDMQGTVHSAVRKRLANAGRTDLIQALSQAGRQRSASKAMTGRVARSAEGARARREARFEEIHFLLSCGQSPSTIARDLKVSPAAISKQAGRWGEREIERAFNTGALARYRYRSTKGVAA